jgi:ribonuclease HII
MENLPARNVISKLLSGGVHSYNLDKLRKLLQGVPIEALPHLIPELEADPRAGAQKLAQTLTRRWKQRALQQQEFRSRWLLEDDLHSSGFDVVAGVDESGRGPLAGPVVAAAVVLSRKLKLPALNDSKQLTPDKREELAAQLRTEARDYAVVEIGVDFIDQKNILNAALEAMRRAVGQLNPEPDHVLVDGDTAIPQLDTLQQPVVGGDGLSNSIAAASILAKVHRDRIMMEYHEQFPSYNFASNKGYATREHLEALKEHGRCPLHRCSFRPCLPKQELGEWGEAAAAHYLEEKGLELRCRNFTRPFGEIDLVCRDGAQLVFVEVRTGRPGTPPGQLLSSVDLEKQARLLRLARAYVAACGEPQPVDFRLDVIAVTPQIVRSQWNEEWKPLVSYVEAAFGATGKL